MAHFSSSALEAFAEIISARYSGTEMTRLFAKAGYPEYVHDGSTKSRWALAVLEQLNSRSGGSLNAAKVIETLCNPEGYLGKPEYHKSILDQVNEVLVFYKLEVRDTGKIVKAPNAEAKLKARESEDERLFDVRRYHPEIIRHSRKLFSQGRYFQAVFEACKAFNKAIEGKAQIGKTGSDLMAAAFSTKGPLKLNALETDTDRNEQEGVMHLCIGVMRAVRNPEAHEPELDWPMGQEDALDVLALLSFLYRKADKAVRYPPL